MKPFYISLSLLFFVTARAQQPSEVVINCSWPCPTASDVCEITANGASCQPRRGSQWIMTAPDQSPIYIGPHAGLNQPCLLAPIPSLPAASSGETGGPGSTIIHWPPNTPNRPLDQYLSNCGNRLFCSADNNASPVCHLRFNPGASCTSANQCFSRNCANGTCQARNTKLARRSAGATFAEHHDGAAFNIVHVMAAVFGIIGAAIVGVIVFIMFRRRRQRKMQQHEQQAEQAIASIDEIGDGERPCSTVNNKDSSRSISRFDKFANAYCHEQRYADTATSGMTENHPSPSMQQIQLQLQLLKQQYDQRPSGGSVVPPPPYQP
ncbi:uncharacterized protein BYT42DRAFT_563565 [Radiomyces spectabilis]|uniref:uncharacterized protein n=1 Tax=Radiomyces spectabilis TaxID=64574 RepID=UPI00221F5AB3|nr:uncharacterized protein BYT42DRAFT_563565 [Radiomyces spectabilis]KAI8384761.1 hypothetical protein BYT42DRAFT_563565 [Radiomyces spectabilis]